MRGLAVILLASWLAHSGRAVANDSHIEIVDVSPAFAPGPYTSLKVDGRDPRILAVGTQSGVVSWSSDSGRSAQQSEAVIARSYNYIGLRTDNRAWAPYKDPPNTLDGLNTNFLTSPSWASSLAAHGNPAGQPHAIRAQSDRVFGKGNASEFAQSNMPAGDRLFMNLLNAGRSTLRWQRWMSVDDTPVTINDVAFTGAKGFLVAATAQGISISDRGRGAWIQAAGVPHPRRSAIQDTDPDGAGLQGTAVAVDPLDPKHVLAATSAGLLVSHDGGESFLPHPDPKLADEIIYHFTWDAMNPDRVVALGGRSVLISKDRGKTFATALSTAADINALAIGTEATYAATHDCLLQVGFDGKIKKLIRDEPVVGVIALGQGLLLVATESTLEVLQQGNPEPVVLKRAHPADPFVALAGGAEISYALTKNGIYRVGAAEPHGGPTAPLPRLRLSLAEAQDRVRKYQGLLQPTNSRLQNTRLAAYLLPRSTTLYMGGTIGSSAAAVRDGTYIALPFFQAASLSYSGFFFYVTVDLSNLSQLIPAFWTAANPFDIRAQNLRPQQEDVLNQVRWRYRACTELLAALKRPVADPAEDLFVRLRLEEFAAYLEAMAGEPVVDFSNDPDKQPNEVN